MLTKENLKSIAINTKDVKVVEVDLKKTNMFSIGQQFNNEVLVIHFINLPNLVNKYIYYKIDDIEEEVPLVSDVFIVSRPLMLHSGEVKAQIIARNPNTSMVELTQNFIMRIKPSNYSGIGEDENYPDDPNIKNYYVKIDGKIQSMDELIALVQSKLDNGEFVGAQGPKGEKGDPGDVTEEYRNLASQIAQNASDAQTSATNSQTSASNAQKILDDTKTFANQTKEELNQIKTDTNTLKEEANTSAVNAKASETKAKEYADNLQASTDDISKLKEDITNIKKKKNVVIHIGSAELSAEQKLSCDYVCDGVDDQIEINQAIDSLPDSGGEIHLSRGIFNISNEISISKRIKIVGEGKGITLDRSSVNNGGTTLLSELTSGCIITIEKSDTLSDIKGITLSDFQIVGVGINVENNYCNGINVTTYTDCVTLERLAFCHCFYGLFVDQTATVDDISVTNCDFQRDTTGIFINGQGWQTRIENNIFWDMSGRQETSGIVLSAGKNIVNGNYFGVSSLVFQGRPNAWIYAKNAVSLLCNGNSFSRCTSSPIRFEAGGQFASISGNSFSEIGKAQFQTNERAVLYIDGAGTGGGRISFTNNTVFWANGDDWKTSYIAYLTNGVAQVNISNNTVIDGIGKINEDELVYKSEDSTYAITIGNNVLC